ncbi:protein SRC2-like [Juglans microcarpa x Juglans regia]|uniref:protein SRC2-like n=1 Tax=Juglans microcarpa x Juglans regia TaxID=2249226 RepID=UPI001B7F3D04|nr:protein SRC2-like [Juglans microcarpa x Juglans regia]
MEYRTLEINVTSAKDLKDLNLFSKMDVYVVVSLSGDKQKAKTKVDREGGTSPSWNFPVKFTIDESAARQNRLNLEFKLRCDRSLGGDKDVGVVYVPVAELLNSTGDGKSMQFVSYQVTKPSGKPQGMLNFSYKFIEKVAAGGEPLVPEAKAHEPVTAYPAPVVGTSALPYDGLYPPAAAPHPPPPPYGIGYPPPPPGYGYPPPPPGYGYPPPPPGYGYPPPPPPPGYGYQPGVQQPQKKNKFGMGLGAGLLGGALGGLLIGDMVSDAGCDAGFGDFGAF